MKAAYRFACVLLALFCGACSLVEQGDRFEARPVAYEQLAGWHSDDASQAVATFLATCPKLTARARAQSSGSGLEISESLWRSLCDEAARVPPGDSLQARAFFERRFAPYRIANRGREQGLFTGYYEPLLYGSKVKQGDFAYPVYMLPPDLKSGTPYYTHGEINSGALDKRRLEIVWVDDPVMLFFMQIQGSGRIRLTDRREMLVGYAGKNGHAYSSLGKIMGDEGLIPKDQINFFTIRQWLYKNRERAFELMEKNASYVFFRKLDVNRPVGAAGVELTPGRSLAVDSRYIPYGLPVFLETELPAEPQRPPAPFQRVMIAQDTGGAIKGPVRGDIFFGGGDEAEYFAGHMKGRGIYSLLVPREIAGQL